MVVDGSVLLAVLLRTSDAARFDAALANAPVRLISAVTRAEVACAIESRKGAPGRTVLERLLREGDIETAAVTPSRRTSLLMRSADSARTGRRPH
jgi:uncharacterized protein with PIN domain